MGLEPVLNQGPYLFVPLHGFGANKDVLEFSEGVQICSYDENKIDLLLGPGSRLGSTCVYIRLSTSYKPDPRTLRSTYW